MAYVKQYSTIIVPTTKYRSWSAPISDIASSEKHNIPLPYIHQNNILIKGTLLRPYSKMYVYFDGVNVSAMCKPLTSGEYTANSAGVAAIGAQISSTSTGDVYCRLYLPAGRFTVGDKVVRITDSDIPEIESSYAEALFSAKGNIVVRTPYIENVPTVIATDVWVPDPPIPPRPHCARGWWWWNGDQVCQWGWTSWSD